MGWDSREEGGEGQENTVVWDREINQSEIMCGGAFASA